MSVRIPGVSRKCECTFSDDCCQHEPGEGCTRMGVARAWIAPQRGAPSIDFDGTWYCRECYVAALTDGDSVNHAPSDDDIDAHDDHERAETYFGALIGHATRAEKWSAR